MTFQCTHFTDSKFRILWKFLLPHMHFQLCKNLRNIYPFMALPGRPAISQILLKFGGNLFCNFSATSFLRFNNYNAFSRGTSSHSCFVFITTSRFFYIACPNDYPVLLSSFKDISRECGLWRFTWMKAGEFTTSRSKLWSITKEHYRTVSRHCWDVA